MKKVVIKVAIACLIVVGVGTGGYYGYKKYTASKTTIATTSYITMRASKTNLQVNIQGTGSVFAGTSRDIANSSAGEIKNLNVNVGDKVTKDSKLFTISNDSLQQAIDKAQNALDKQKLQLSNAQNTLATAEQTLADAKAAEANGTAITQTNGQTNNQGGGQGTVTVATAQAAVDKAKLDVSTAQLAVKDAERDLTSAKTTKNDATVKSPIDGLIIAKNKTTGDSIQPNTAILTVIDTNSLKVKVAVDELDIQKVKLGQKAEIKFGAIKDKTYEGTVEQIALTGTTSNNVTTYNVTVGISNPENVKLGMNANVNILIDSKENALVIPSEALIERNGKKYVMVPNSDGNTSSGAGGSAPQNNGSSQGTAPTQNNERAGSQQSQNGGSSSNSASSGQNTGSRQNGQAGQNGGYSRTTSTGNGKLVEIKTGLESQNYIEVLEGIAEGQQLLVALPQTSTNNTNNRNNMGGFGGNAGGLGGNPGGFGGNGNTNNAAKQSTGGK